MSCSSKRRVFQVAYRPLKSGITVHVTSITFTVFKLEKSLKHYNYFWQYNSVNNNIDCLVSNDRLEYNWLPTVII